MTSSVAARRRGIQAACIAALSCLVSTTVACEPQCTELGCGIHDGVQVTFDRLPRSSARESFELSDGQVTVHCERASHVCVLPSRHPAKILVRRMEGGQVATERTVDVHFETVHPNGPECPGECSLGRVAVTW